MSANSIYHQRSLQPAGRSAGGASGSGGGGGGGGAPSGPGGNGAGGPPPVTVSLGNPAPPPSIALGGAGQAGGPPGLPPGPGTAPLAFPGAMRLNESFDAIKAEFENMLNEVELCKTQKEEVEAKLGQQMAELTAIRGALFDLERQHGKIRQSYEDEIAKLRSDLAALHSNRNPPPPPAGLAGLGVVAGPGTPGYRGQQHLQDPAGGPPLAGPPGPLPPGYENGVTRGSDLPPSLDGRRGGGMSKDGPRDRGERVRERERDREFADELRERDLIMREREREREMMAVDRMGGRDRDRRDFEMDREREMREREREMDRLADGRDPKRPKKDNGAYPGSHTTTPRLPPSHALYGPAGTSSGPGPSSNGPTGSPYTSAPPPLGHPANGAPPPPGSAGGPLTKNEGANGGMNALGLGPPPSAGGPPPSNALGPASDEFNYNNVPLEYRKDGPDWFAAFNPKIKKTLDIQLVHSFQHSSVVCCVQFSQDGRYLATGCNQTAQIFDTKSGLKVCELSHESEQHTGDLYIRSVRFSPDGKLLATGAEDRQIRIWDIARKRIRQTFDGHQQEIYSLDFSQDGRLIVSGSGDRTTRIWDMAEPNNCKVFTITDVIDHNTDAGVTSVAISPSTALVAAGSLDNIIRIWDVATGQLLERLRGHTNSVYSVAFTPDGKGLVTGSLDKTLKLWDVSHLNTVEGRRKAADNPDQRDRVERERMERMEREGKIVQSANCLMDFIGHKDYVLSVSMSSDSRWVVSGSKDRCVHVWDSATATLQLMLQGHKNSVISLDLNSNNDLLATGSGDSFARIWSLGRI